MEEKDDVQKEDKVQTMLVNVLAKLGNIQLQRKSLSKEEVGLLEEAARLRDIMAAREETDG